MAVAITGLGVVSCLGNTVSTLWECITKGSSGISNIKFKPKVIKTRKVGYVQNFELDDVFDSRWKNKCDMHIQYALNATKQAVEQSGLDFNYINPNKVHTIIGTTAGSYNFIIDNQERINQGKPALPNFIPGHINNMPSAYINMHYNITGSGLGISGACAGGGQAISIGSLLIETGLADVVICGASDSWLSELTISGFESLGALSFNDLLPRPFDSNRDGFAISEGAGIIVLENYEFAKKRNANILSILSGWSIGSDAYHPTSPDPSGIVFEYMINSALAKAQLDKNKIDYINAHATATKIGDAIECQSLARIFGTSPFLSSTKSMTGHSIGSTSAIEAIICVKTLETNTIPGTINLKNIDINCPGNHLKETIHNNTKHILSNSFGFGGTNNVLIFSKEI